MDAIPLFVIALLTFIAGLGILFFLGLVIFLLVVNKDLHFRDTP